MASFSETVKIWTIDFYMNLFSLANEAQYSFSTTFFIMAQFGPSSAKVICISVPKITVSYVSSICLFEEAEGYVIFKKFRLKKKKITYFLFIAILVI